MPTYNTATVTARMAALASVIDGGGSNGSIVLLAGGTPVSTIPLNRPCATADGGVLTFITTPSSISISLLDPSAAGTGNVTGCRIQDSNGNVVISGLTAGIPGSSADVVISNGSNSTLVTAGQPVSVLAAQITGGND